MGWLGLRANGAQPVDWLVVGLVIRNLADEDEWC